MTAVFRRRPGSHKGSSQPVTIAACSITARLCELTLPEAWESVPPKHEWPLNYGCRLPPVNADQTQPDRKHRHGISYLCEALL